MVLNVTRLLLLLAGLGGAISTEREQRSSDGTSTYGPSAVVITGVSTVTVGIPYGFQCSASCSPACTYTWSRDGQTSSGSELQILLHKLRGPEVLTCQALNPVTGSSASTNITIQVTEGPSNIQISGPAMLLPERNSTFTCSADCFPSCVYDWTVNSLMVANQGAEISVQTQLYATSETLTCEAQDSVSQLFISTTITVYVARGPSELQIRGPSGPVTMGNTYNFLCIAYCTPSCNFTWTYNGQTFPGDTLNMPILHKGDKLREASKLAVTITQYYQKEVITCTAVNSISGETVVINDTLNVLDPISVQPVTQTPPLAGKPFSLQCVGSENPGSIVWYYNGTLLEQSNRVHLSPFNLTLTFSPLLQTDGGLYQCVVSQGGIDIKARGYQMKVNYGPVDVAITKAGDIPVGPVVLLLPGADSSLHCSAHCHLKCSYTWLLNNQVVGLNANLSLAPVTGSDHGALSCVVFNPVTGQSGSAETTLKLIDGPLNVTISGPHTLEIGEKASFVCSAICTPPPCEFSWTVFGRRVSGSKLDLTVSQYQSAESLSCEARNTISGKTAMVNETVTITDPDWCGC